MRECCTWPVRTWNLPCQQSCRRLGVGMQNCSLNHLGLSFIGFINNEPLSLLKSSYLVMFSLIFIQAFRIFKQGDHNHNSAIFLVPWQLRPLSCDCCLVLSANTVIPASSFSSELEWIFRENSIFHSWIHWKCPAWILEWQPSEQLQFVFLPFPLTRYVKYSNIELSSITLYTAMALLQQDTVKDWLKYVIQLFRGAHIYRNAREPGTYPIQSNFPPRLLNFLRKFWEHYRSRHKYWVKASGPPQTGRSRQTFDPPEMERKGLLQSASDTLSDVRPSVSQRQNMSSIGLGHPTHQPIKSSFADYLAMFTRFRSHTRIVGKVNLFDFATIFAGLTAPTCTRKRGNL